MNMKAYNFNKRKYLLSAFAMLMLYCKNKLIKLQMEKLAKDFFVRHTGLYLWTKWKEKTIEKLDRREKSNMAKSTYKENLLIKSFAVFKDRHRVRAAEKVLEERADHLHKDNVLLKAIEVLRVYSIEMKGAKIKQNVLVKALSVITNKLKRQFLLDWKSYNESYKVVKNRVKNIIRGMRRYLIIRNLRHYKNQVKKVGEYDKRIQEISLNVKKIKVQSIFQAWFNRSHKKKILNTNYTKYTTMHSKAIKENIMKKWKEIALKLHNCNTIADKIKSMKRIKVLREYLLNWKLNCIDLKNFNKNIERAIKQYKEVSLVKAFAILKFHKRQKLFAKQKKQDADSLHSSFIAHKTFNSLRYYPSTLQTQTMQLHTLSQQLIIIREQNVKQLVLHGLLSLVAHRKQAPINQAVPGIKHNKCLMKTCEDPNDSKEVILISMKEIFDSWRKLAGRRNVLRHYLKKSNVNSKYASPQRTDYRFELALLNNIIQDNAISPDSILSHTDHIMVINEFT